MADYLSFVAKMKAKPGKEGELREALLSLVPPTHAEPGCVQYDLHQSIEDPALFVFYENWTGERALGEHLKSSHVQTALARALGSLAAPPEFYRLKKISRPKAVPLQKK